MERNFIPKELYRKFTSKMPLSCVEMVVESQGKFILVKRKDPPEKNQWWFPGGRIYFNESSAVTVRRKLSEELGIKKPRLIKFLGLGESKFKKGYFNLPSHTFNAIFLVRVSPTQARNIKLDKVGHYDYRWQRKIPKSISPYLKKFLRLAGFK